MILQLGWRNIWRNRRRTAVILTAVVLGVWAMIVLGALMRGIGDQLVRNGIRTLTGHLQIQHPGFRSDPALENRLPQPERALAALAVLPPDARWAPRLRVSAVASNARHSGGITLVGIDPAREAGVSFVGEPVAAGRPLDPEDLHGLVVGAALLEKFEAEPGSKLVLMAQDSAGEIASRAFRIVGVFQAELESTEKQFVFATLPAVREMLAAEDGLTEVAVLLSSPEQTEEAAAALRRQLPAGAYAVLTWRELLPLITAVLGMYDGFILFWYLAVFIAMGFGLVNTILMAVFERMREIGLLRALGMGPRLIIGEVLAESFFLLLLGTIAGNLLGWLTVRALAGPGIDLSAFAEATEFAGVARVIFPAIHLQDVLSANLIVFGLGLLVSVYPAVKAARFSPVEAMARQ